MSNNYEELAERAKTVNQQIIEEFRANGGKVGNLPGANFLLLHTRGAKSNQERITPVLYFKDGDTCSAPGRYSKTYTVKFRFVSQPVTCDPNYHLLV